MLLITRMTPRRDKPDKDSLMIGENIEIRILKIKGRQVKLGINAPKDIIVLRKELITQGMKEYDRTDR